MHWLFSEIQIPVQRYLTGAEVHFIFKERRFSPFLGAAGLQDSAPPSVHTSMPKDLI